MFPTTKTKGDDVWKISIGCDILRGKFSEEYNAFPYWEVFYVLAVKDKKAYIHFYNFMDDWEKANKLVARIRACHDFTPEGKPKLWHRIVDTRPFNAATRWKRKKYIKIGDFMRR